jgi:hypothetical protein
MARYSLAHTGEKNINLGAFVDPKHAAYAFDAEARRRGRPDAHLNFPDLHPSHAKIEEWNMHGAHYSMMGSGHKKASQYRGVTVQKGGSFYVQINIKKVLAGLGKEKGPASIGFFKHEKEAALAFDRVCRKYGVPEKGLNFPRDGQLKEVRLFDNECYFCCQERPADPVATPCNHIFCRPCVSMWLTGRKQCPCCQTPVASEEVLRPVDLVPWSKEKKSEKAAEVAAHRDGSNDEGGSNNEDRGNKSTNSSLGESESEDDEEVEAAEEDSEPIDGQDDDSRHAALRSGESEVGLVSATSTCAKTVATKRKVSCVPEQVEGMRRQVESHNEADRVVKERRPVNDSGSVSDEAEIIEIPTISVKTKTLETERKASCASNHAEGKRRRAESRNDTDRLVKERRPAKDRGNASRVSDGGTEMDEVEIIEIQDSGSEMDEVEIIEKPTKTLETKRKASCASKHVEGKRRKVESRNDTVRVVKERRPGKDCRSASRIQDGGSEMDKVEMFEPFTSSSEKIKTLEKKRKASCTPKRAGDKRRKSEAHNDTDGTSFACERWQRSS